MDKNILKNFLYELEKFYQPEHPELKDGIGHEIEHIKGVVRRTNEIINTMNDYGYNVENFDKNISVLVAALHDIGNVISRDDHGHLGYGIIMNKLELENVFNVPIEYKMNGDKYISSEQQNHKLLDFVQKNKLDNKHYNLSNLTELNKTEKNILLTAIGIFAKYQVFHNSYSFEEVDEFYEGTLKMNQKDIILSSKELVNRDSDNKVISFNTGQMDNDVTRVRELGQKLKSLSEQLSEVLDNNQEKLKTIAEAVQDHNIDFCMEDEQKTRYEARSIYGMIIADADKDNIPEVFALRTLAFSYNKWAKEMNPGYFADKQGTPIVKICASHILHQSWERSKPEGFTKVFDDCFQYKKIEKIKGISEVTKDGENTQIVPKKDQHGVSMNKMNVGKKYIVSKNQGDDIYSQLDNHFGKCAISMLRHNIVQVCQKWANPDLEKENLDYLLDKVVSVYDKADSIEEAVDVFEKKKWGVQDNSFHAVIDDVLDDESISEKRACDTFVREIQEKVKQHSAKDEEKIELDNQSIEHGIGEMDNFKTENSDANCETNDEHNDDFSGDTI
jgi:HD superfamily phosphodiesterase